MSIVIVLIVVLVVGGLVAKFYPHPKKIEVIEEQPTWNFDSHVADLAPEATPDPTVVTAIKEQIIKEKSNKKPVSKNKAKVKPLAKMEAKKKTIKKSTKK